jgi:cobalamin biosynthetic protein CobC
LAEARRRFPRAPEPFIDLSTGINPIPYDMPALSRECFTRLPEPDGVDALQSVAAAAYGVAEPTMVVAAPGTQILIDLLPRLWHLRSVAVLGPTYAEYVHAWKRVGCCVDEVTDFGALGDADSVVVCNPNNPDGRRIAHSALLDLADRLATRPDGLLVVDEAFADLEEDGLSLAEALPHPALIVLRSFGKTYGLAGLRLGFALAAETRATEVRAALGPWAVSGPAIEVGCEALADRAWLTRTRAQMAESAAMLDQVLEDAGLRVLGGTCLFRLVETKEAHEVFGRLGRAGIFVRRFAEHPEWLRFGQPAGAHAWQRLRAALAS